MFDVLIFALEIDVVAFFVLAILSFMIAIENDNFHEAIFSNVVSVVRLSYFRTLSTSIIPYKSLVHLKFRTIILNLHSDSTNRAMNKYICK